MESPLERLPASAVAQGDSAASAVAPDDNSRDAEMVALTTVDLLILDDFALEAMSKELGAPRPPSST
ncbi:MULTISPECIES: hypothetical protein [Sorangium]|uniref:Uncharacterized protein n=1 Tax=Sorangium cellulosum TaxID=56 RepID=A0A4P2QHD5_SORCE|nr:MULTISPECIES: hypothetical protein [Sorangium]AUX29265.1 uncharacterized protein SOCE836_013530 [Sorangium cellulosum]WCQ88655.1 hypothetical protein NQZ70_01334 [Sorangium sp. Soce836]